MSICRSHDVTGFSAPQADISRTAAYDFFDDRPHTEGYDWLLSNRHPKTDRCASNASGSRTSLGTRYLARTRCAFAAWLPASCRRPSSCGLLQVALWIEIISQ